MPTPSTLLAIESATRTLTLAIACGDEVRATRASTPGHHHAETILPLIDSAFAESGLLLGDVTHFAVSIGPGSFTSLRIGLSTVKGLAFDSPRLIAPISSLHAIAHAAAAKPGTTAPACWLVLLDASRGDAYAAAYAQARAQSSAPGPASAGDAPELEEVLREGVYAPEELAAAISGPCVLVGDAAEAFAPELRARCSHELTLWTEEVCAAEGVALLGARALAAGAGVSAADLAPRYLRRAEAEVQRTSLRFEDDRPGEIP